MKNIALAAVLASTFATIVSAEAPDSVTIRARKGNVTFPHRMHEQAELLKECTLCHTKATGDKIGKLGMSRGHSICRECHTERQAGPRLCDDCHK